MRRGALTNVLGTIAIIGLIFLMPVLIPVAIVLDWNGNRKKRAAALSFRCTGCGEILGEQSLRLADEAWSAEMAEMRKKRPGVRFRVARKLHAICASCGKRYDFVEKDATFVEIGADDDLRVPD